MLNTAILGGVVQAISDPRYLASCVVGTGSPFAKLMVGSTSDLTRIYVFSLFRERL